MKYVVNNSEIPHLWFHQTQDNARNAKESFYFRGKTIYSYGAHFPIARFVSNSVGETAILLTSRTHGVTTSRHYNMVSRAISNGTLVFHVPLRDSSAPGSFINTYQPLIEELSRKLVRVRAQHNKDWLFSDLTKLVGEAKAYAKFFGIDRTFAIPDNFDALKADMARVATEQRAIERT